MRVERVKCDVCGAVVETEATQTGIIAMALPLAPDNTRAEVQVRWRVEFAQRDSDQHFCVACLGNALALAAQSVVAP